MPRRQPMRRTCKHTIPHHDVVRILFSYELFAPDLSICRSLCPYIHFSMEGTVHRPAMNLQPFGCCLYKCGQKGGRPSTLCTSRVSYDKSECMRVCACMKDRAYACCLKLMQNECLCEREGSIQHKCCSRQ